jgi:type IV secretory pathway VirB2 component (pilin)
MRQGGKIAGVIFILICFAAEIYLQKECKQQAKITAVASILIAVLIFLAALYKNKTQKLFSTIFNAFKGGIASLLGLLLIIYAGLQINWFGNYIANYIDKGEDLYRAITTAAFFCIPFFALPFFTRQPVAGSRQPEFLITTLSKNSREQLQLFINAGFNKAEIFKMIPGLKFWNWEPTIEVLKKYGTIQTVFLLISEGVAKEFEGLSSGKFTGVDIYRSMLQQQGLDHVQVQVIPVINPNDLVHFKTELEIKLNDILDNPAYPDEKLIFEITGGTAMASVALVLLAFKGKRRAVYKQQDGGKEIIMMEPDVQSIKELWQQILESL